jgi:heme O synthase-like polyprenyltransferase
MGVVGSGLGQVTTAVGEGAGSLLRGILGGLSPTLLVILGIAAAILIYTNFLKRA